jgi:hypothetical protein
MADSKSNQKEETKKRQRASKHDSVICREEESCLGEVIPAEKKVKWFGKLI